MWRRLVAQPLTEWHERTTEAAATRVVAAHVAPLDERLQAVEAEFYPNGGASLRGQVNEVKSNGQRLQPPPSTPGSARWSSCSSIGPGPSRAPLLRSSSP